MAPRKARASLPVAAPKNARNKNHKRNLDAYSIASHSVPVKRVKQHRLGELLDDRPTQKRRKPASDDEDDDSSEGAILAKRQKPSAAEEDLEEGSDSDGNEWTLGGLKEDDDDSELDSDEAFDEEDEERFSGYTFRGSSSSVNRKSAKSKSRASQLEEEGAEDIDLDEVDEGEDDDEDGFGEEGVDLATMLDDENSDEDMEGEDGSEDDEQQEEDAPSDSESEQDEEEDDDGLDEERIARMRDRVEALDSSTTPKTQAPPRSTGLTMEALLAASGNSPAVKEAAKANKTAKPFEAPLPQRQQDRINRKVASQKANEQLDRWLPTVKQRREAEHLSFPLVDPERSEPLGKDKFVNTTVPHNEFEKAMHDILEQSGMIGDNNPEEDGSIQAEGLIENKPSLQEVLQQRAELRRKRDILFDAERKAKRVSKIKSKSYRRVHRRERQRIAEYEKEMRGSDDEDEREAAERKRAEARMSVKGRDSKWAKSLKASNRMVWDESAREGVEEGARREEELRRRIAGEDVDEDGSGESEDEGGSDVNGDVQTLKKLERISKEGRHGEKVSGLPGLDFMRAADERQRKRNEEDIERLRKELAVEDGDEGKSDDDVNGMVDDQGLGRAIFGPKAKELKEPAKKVKRPELEEGDASEGDISEDEAEVVVSNEKSKERPSNRNNAKSNANGNALNHSTLNMINDNRSQSWEAKSPWMVKPPKAGKLNAGRSTNRTTLPVTDNQSDEDTTTSAYQAQGKVAVPSENAVNTHSWTTVKYNNDNEDDHDSNSEVDSPNPILTKQQQQSEYYARAFAGDNVKRTFESEKADAIASEDEKETSTHLPGWGSWTGGGLTKSIKKANARQRHNPLYKTKVPGVRAEDRKDAKLENVIISEKSDRKGKKYQADLLPHVFETKGQYERSLRVPMGPEWVTKETHQRATKPRVVVKPGVVIGAMEKPLV